MIRPTYRQYYRIRHILENGSKLSLLIGEVDFFPIESSNFNYFFFERDSTYRQLSFLIGDVNVTFLRLQRPFY